MRCLLDDEVILADELAINQNKIVICKVLHIALVATLHGVHVEVSIQECNRLIEIVKYDQDSLTPSEMLPTFRCLRSMPLSSLFARTSSSASTLCTCINVVELIQGSVKRVDRPEKERAKCVPRQPHSLRHPRSHPSQAPPPLSSCPPHQPPSPSSPSSERRPEPADPRWPTYPARHSNSSTP